MFTIALRAWVGFFVSDKSVSEHYIQIISDTLSPMSCFKEKGDVMYIKYRWCKRITVYVSDWYKGRYAGLYDQGEDSDEDLPDAWT